jgi:hypothetical protein
VTPDTTTTREYQVRWPNGEVTGFQGDVNAARDSVAFNPAAKVYARTITTTRSAWAEVVEAPHG